MFSKLAYTIGGECREAITLLGVVKMQLNIFMEAASHAETIAPYEKKLMIIPAEKRDEIFSEFPNLFQYPFLYVTQLGYVPYATKKEILRRREADLFLFGGDDAISEWVSYILATLTEGKVYRIEEEYKVV